MIRSSSVLFWFALVIMASVALYRTSDRVQALDRQLNAVNAAIENEQQSLHVLKAEWVYLANPDRVKALTQRHLSLAPTAPRQMVALANLAAVLPTRRESMEDVAVNATPIANIHASLAALSPAPHFVPRHVRAADARVASADTGHITDHMTIRHAAASAQQVSLDPIGSLIGQLDAHP